MQRMATDAPRAPLQSTPRSDTLLRQRRVDVVRGLLVSLAIHGAIAAAILGTAIGVAAVRERAPIVVLTADFFAPAPHAATLTPVPDDAFAASAREDSSKKAERASATASLDAQLRQLEQQSAANPAMDALARRFGALEAANANSDAASSLASADRARVGASFAGLFAGNATRVAYVVDASGSMLGSFPALIDEVERSLQRLEPTQSFTVICFLKDGALPLQGDASLRAASQAARENAVRWLRERVVPAGRSSPLKALALALGSGADCVFLLSTTQTGPGSHELDRDSMLAMLDRLNPRDAESGARRVTIQCIQFLEPDPGQTLQAIAAEHYGENGFRFIPRSATTLDATHDLNHDPHSRP